MNSVGANIKARRRELGMNQDELARRLGLTQANISRIEGDKKTTNSSAYVITSRRSAHFLSNHS